MDKRIGAVYPVVNSFNIEAAVPMPNQGVEGKGWV